MGGMVVVVVFERVGRSHPDPSRSFVAFYSQTLFEEPKSPLRNSRLLREAVDSRF